MAFWDRLRESVGRDRDDDRERERERWRKASDRFGDRHPNNDTTDFDDDRERGFERNGSNRGGEDWDRNRNRW